MDSFAIWYEQKNEDEKEEVEATLNFNLWKLDGLYKYQHFHTKALRNLEYKEELNRTKECNYAFDVGVNVEKIYICIYHLN